MAKKPTISTIIITYNAGNIFPQVLKKVSLFSDEIVVVDSGSTNDTVDIARKYHARVYTKKFDGDFSAQKNFALSKTTGDWIFSVDADEVPGDELVINIPHLTARLYDGYWIKRRNYYAPGKYFRYGLFYPDWQLRLFRNNHGYRFTGAIHEHVEISNDKTLYTDYELHHYQQYPKYSSRAGFTYLMPYITIHAREISRENHTSFYLFFRALWLFLKLFFGGYVRGKGFLDGIPGLRAHVFFAYSISKAYINAKSKYI